MLPDQVNYPPRFLGPLLLIAVVCCSNGCATMFRGTSETVTVKTNPPGQSVYYRGNKISDGERVTVRKGFKAPRFNVGAARSPHMTSMSYDPDVWVVGDVAWLLLGILPGLIAGGVDMGTGAWRDLDERQVVHVPERQVAKPQLTKEKPLPRKKPQLKEEPQSEQIETSLGPVTRPIEP